MTVKGNTVLWNQLIPADLFGTGTISGVTITNNNDGSYTLNGTANAPIGLNPTAGVVKGKGHKCLLLGCRGGSLSTYYFMDGWTGAGDSGNGIIFTANDSNNPYITLRIVQGTVLSNIKIYPQLFDLTLMYGSGNQPSTVEKFTALYPSIYYPYDVGSIKNTPPQRVKSISKNLFDKEYFSKYGNYSIDATYKIAKIKNLKPSTAYKFSLIAKKAIGIAGIYYITNSSTTNFNGSGYASLVSGSNIMTSPPAIVSSPSGELFVGVYPATEANLLEVMNSVDIQLEEGTTATAYEPYSATEAYIPELGKWDSFNILTGECIRGGNDTVIDGSKIYSLYSGVNNQLVITTSFLDQKPWNGLTDNIIIDGMTQIEDDTWDLVISRGTFYGSASGSTVFVFALSTFATVAAAQAYFNANPKKMYYQKAQATMEYYPANTVMTGPYYTVIVGPGYTDVGW
jgi:hypothetical protein